MTREERHMIDVMEKARADKTAQLRTAYNDGLTEGKAEGLAEGLARGETKAQAAIIANALSAGLDDATIARITGLAIDDIARLRAER
jgi:flagellar biosynthesis/type III secretory pathway protein FliH